MLRWQDKLETTYYREKYIPLKTNNVPNENQELDFYAYKYLDSELFTYKLIDVNFTEYIETRGNTSLMKNILIPVG